MQVLSGSIPFYEEPGYVSAYNSIVNGKHPRRPSNPWVTDDHWLFMMSCWSDYGSGDRPAVADVLEYVKAEAVRTREEEIRILRKEEDDRELLDLTGYLERESEFPSAGGGFADIWRATWRRDSATCKVGAVPRMFLHRLMTLSRWLSRYCDIILTMSTLETN